LLQDSNVGAGFTDEGVAQGERARDGLAGIGSVAPSVELARPSAGDDEVNLEILSRRSEPPGFRSAAHLNDDRVRPGDIALARASWPVAA